MTNSIRRFIKGYVSLRLTGSQTDRFLNLCSANKLNMWNIKDDRTHYLICMSIDDFKKTQPIVRKTKTRIHITKRFGLPFVLHKNRKRKAFFFGVFLFFILLHLLSLRIWNIQIEGNMTCSKDSIINCLEEQNIYHGIAKKQVHCSKIAMFLRKNFANFTWVSCKINGTHLVIEIKENNQSHPKENPTTDIPCSIIAPKDGIIISIITRNGTPKVIEGQTVNKGDVLVSGVIEIKNDSNEIIDYRYVVSDAEIYIMTNYAYYDEFKMNYQKRIYKDDRKKTYFIELFHYRIKLPFLKKGTAYDQLSKTYPVHLTESFQLPLNYGLIYTFPYQIKEYRYTLDEARQKSEQNLYTFLKNLSQKGVEIYRKDVKINTSEKTCITKGWITVKEKVTEKKPVTTERILSET